MLARSKNPSVALPPICAWKSFTDSIDRFKETALPNFVTHEALPTVSADVRGRVITSMRALHLVAPNGESQPFLRQLVAARGTGQWEVQLRVLLANAYPYAPVNILAQADTAALRAKFAAHIGRETANITKCEAFYLSMARAAGVQLSAALKKRVAASDTMATVRAARTSKPKVASEEKSTTMANTKPMSKQERADKILDILRMFQNEGLPGEQLAALLSLWDYAKKIAEE
jgi:hypothetical protein